MRVNFYAFALAATIVLLPLAPKGNKNAMKHGRYTAEAIAMRAL